MSHTIKLLAAVGLGLLAAILNFVVISSRTNPVKFATLKEAVRAGTTITTDMITSIDVPAQFAESLSKSAVPMEDMAVLSGKAASQDIEAGILLLWDFVPIRGPQYDLRDGETAVFIDVSRSPVASISVGEQISFRLPIDDQESGFEWIGPFRVVTVGDNRVRGDRNDRVNEISIAMPETTTDPRFVKLQSYLDRVTDGEDLPLQIRAHRES
ncbi:CpaB family protein [Neorhodopirellula pilleata]|uniref:SAF domain-containing protein n=1 Tax=Neorhodopirellula pilleata TaxID=2714738 RepID=A0A5C6AW68_9BACT|nr:SAF domain-containing protein [Neorhodopirellula pilleata]TWU03701.1 hypothetical protein Pla100_06310 [Neorhodopirellula pilleata]